MSRSAAYSGNSEVALTFSLDFLRPGGTPGGEEEGLRQDVGPVQPMKSAWIVFDSRRKFFEDEYAQERSQKSLRRHREWCLVISPCHSILFSN